MQLKNVHYVIKLTCRWKKFADFTNFSEEMAPRDSFTITLEYFCFEHDELWGLKKNDLINLDINELFQEYPNKNLAIIMIENNKIKNEKVYLKTRVQGKDISKSISVSRQNLDLAQFYQKIILETKKELTNLVKSKNLIDIRTPSFLNVKLNLDDKSNLVELNSRIKNIDLIDNIFVQDFNKDHMNLKIKYLGKLEKMINQLNTKKINLELIKDEWVLRVL